jgi:hypothetical protein
MKIAQTYRKLHISGALLALASIAIGNVAVAQISPYELWTFDTDAVGTDLNDLANTGSNGSAWNFNTPDDTVISGGLFEITNAAGGTSTRKIVYGTAVSGGSWLWQIDLSSWDFSDLADNDQITIKVAGDSSDAAGIAFKRVDASTFQVRQFTSTDGGARYRNTDLTISGSTAMTIGIEFNLDAGTVSYLIDGSETYSWSDFNQTSITGLTYSKGGSWPSGSSNVTLDSMGLYAVVPEASTFALLAGFAALGLVIIRRRR